MSKNRDLERIQNKSHQIEQQERIPHTLENPLRGRLGLSERANHWAILSLELAPIANKIRVYSFDSPWSIG